MVRQAGARRRGAEFPPLSPRRTPRRVADAGRETGGGGAAQSRPMPKVGTTACCVPVQSDPENCGACGVACRPDQVCLSGTCACPTGTTICGTGASATCANFQNDPHNCGGCGQACPTGQICASGMCQVSCPSPEVTCGGQCVDLSSNNAHCGTCTTACPSGEVCQSGMCQPSCLAGETFCNGECVDLTRDPENCGEHGIAAVALSRPHCRVDGSGTAA